MLKSIVMMDLPIDDIAPMERWYYEAHSSEISRRYGPFLQRHESYVALDAPEDARRFGFYNWRVTETFWREMPESGAKGRLLLHPGARLEPRRHLHGQGPAGQRLLRLGRVLHPGRQHPLVHPHAVPPRGTAERG